jgi:hypothetical protein
MLKNAVRILIAHTGEMLAAQDVNEILIYAWDGSIAVDCKITAHQVTQNPVSSDKEFAYAWLMWQQMLKYKEKEHPFWEDHKTHPYQGTIVRTQQCFYLEIYY